MHIYWALSALIISTLPIKTRQCHRFAVRDGMGRIYLFVFVFELCLLVIFRGETHYFHETNNVKKTVRGYGVFISKSISKD